MSAERFEAGIIRQFAGEMSALVAAEYAGDPVGELTVWLQMALRREASVGQIYDLANLERRLAQVSGPPQFIALVRRTFSNIWAQEKAHAIYLESMLATVAKPSRFLPWLVARADALMGALEGHLLSARTSPGRRQQLKASLMMSAGRLVQDIPEFLGALSALPFPDFCRLNAELEVTAIHGYQRMLVLLDQAAEDSFTRDTTLRLDLQRFVLDEEFHNQTFLAMDGWFTAGPAGALRPAVSLEACRAQLASIRAGVYGEPVPRRAKKKASPVRSARASAGAPRHPTRH